MVDHITTQHANTFKISKSKYHKHDPYPTRSFKTKAQRDEQWQSSPVMSTSKTASDPFLSFLCGATAASESSENVQPDSSSEASIQEIHSDDTVVER